MKALACFVVATVAMLGNAVAQDNADRSKAAIGTNQTMGQAEKERQAPVGHRQPTPKDLPPAVRREEAAPILEDRDLDSKLRICRGC
jgi:hypothetical protein